MCGGYLSKMGRTIILTPRQRRDRLTKLIDDAKQLKFRCPLIEEYESQLREVEEEIQALKDKQQAFRGENGS